MDTLFMINFNSVLENFGGDEELLLNTIDLSLKLIPQHVEKIRRSISEKDAKGLEISAHTLKGSLSIYLYSPITNIAFTLEKMGRGNTFDNASENLSNLENELICFYKNLESFSAKNQLPPQNSTGQI